jgi:hypothetical protein
VLKTVFFAVSLVLVQGLAWAAQSGRVVVEDAAVYEFPQKSAKVIARLKKDSVHAVSNLKTEGFYKIRLSGGETGWISGNDLFAGGGALPSDTGPGPEARVNGRRQLSDDLIDRERFLGANYRVQLGFGLSNLAFGGLSDHFQGTSSLNFGKIYSFEIQRKLYFPLSLAFRAELRGSKTGDLDLGGGTTQTFEHSAIPLQLGVLYFPIHTQRWRVGIGGYGGITAVSFTEVVQTTTSQTNSVKFSAMDLVGTGVIQVAYGLGRAFGIFGEFGYQYQVTSDLPATTALGNIPAFKLNYSGYLFKGGIELRF